MIATTVYIMPQFYMFTMRSTKRRHTHSDENSIMLCAAASLSLSLSKKFLSLCDVRGTSSTEKGEKNCKNTRPEWLLPSAHNVHPLMRSSVQIHIFTVVVDQHNIFYVSILPF